MANSSDDENLLAMVITHYLSPLGWLEITYQNHVLIKIQFITAPKTTVANTNSATEQLQQFFTNPKHSFTLPMKLIGTTFQQRVWQQLQRIPVGTTVSYGGLAQQLNSSPRAIANACRNNPIPIIVPCHRVIAKQGIGGYSGQTSGAPITQKKWLLNHEGVVA